MRVPLALAVIGSTKATPEKAVFSPVLQAVWVLVVVAEVTVAVLVLVVKVTVVSTPMTTCVMVDKTVNMVKVVVVVKMVVVRDSSASSG